MHYLEERLIAELKVFRDLYGFKSSEQEEWARSCMQPHEAEYFIRSWREGRRLAWRRLQTVAHKLRSAGGYSDEDWAARLQALEALEQVATSYIQPTTRSAFLDTESQPL